MLQNARVTAFTVSQLLGENQQEWEIIPQTSVTQIKVKKIHESVLQSTNNTKADVSITDKSNNTNAENECQTLLNKLETLNPNK